MKVAQTKHGRYEPKTKPKKKVYNSEYYRRRYAETLAKIDAYKVGCGCKDCGYNHHPAGLEFDHLPGFVKSGSPSGFAGRGWRSVLKEIAKCEVVCGTCHNICTWARKRELVAPTGLEPALS